MNKYIRLVIIVIVSLGLFYTTQKEQNILMKMQNKLTLDGTLQCVNTNVETEKELYNEFTKCGLKRLSLGRTGDMFVIRKDDLLLFWDNSSDCRPSKNDKMYMTKNGICSLFNDSKSCERAIKYMKNKKHGFTDWLFDESKEIIYFKTIKVNGKEYIVGQGSQTDESDRYYVLIRYAIFVSFIILGAIVLI